MVGWGVKTGRESELEVVRLGVCARQCRGHLGTGSLAAAQRHFPLGVDLQEPRAQSEAGSLHVLRGCNRRFGRIR